MKAFFVFPLLLASAPAFATKADNQQICGVLKAARPSTDLAKCVKTGKVSYVFSEFGGSDAAWVYWGKLSNRNDNDYVCRGSLIPGMGPVFGSCEIEK